MDLVPMRQRPGDALASDAATTAQRRVLVIDEEQPHATKNNA